MPSRRRPTSTRPRPRPATSLRLPSPPARRFPQGPCVCSTGGSAGGRFASISGQEERQPTLAFAAQAVEVEVDPGARGEPPGRLSPVAHGDDALATRLLGARSLKQRLVDAGRIASNERPLGGRGPLPAGKDVCCCTTVSRLRSRHHACRAAVRRALLTFVLALLLASALAATAGAQATVADPTPVTDPVTTTPTVTDPTPVTDPVPGARSDAHDAGADGTGALD